MYHMSCQGVDKCKYLNILITPMRGKDKEDMFQSHTQSYAITSQTLLDLKLSKYVQ